MKELQYADKYIDQFNDLYKKEGAKKAIDFMGIYFYGLIDNISYESFVNIYYRDFIYFTDWLLQGSEPDLFQRLYNWDPYSNDDKNKPLLYKLVDTIDEILDIPDPIEIAARKAYENLTEKSIEMFGNIADWYLDENNAMTVSVDIYRGEDPLYIVDEKITKKQIKEDREGVRQYLIETLALISNLDGSIFVKQKAKDFEKLSAFVCEASNIYAVPKDQLAKSMKEFLRNTKKNILFDNFSFTDMKS